MDYPTLDRCAGSGAGAGRSMSSRGKEVVAVTFDMVGFSNSCRRVVGLVLNPSGTDGALSHFTRSHFGAYRLFSCRFGRFNGRGLVSHERSWLTEMLLVGSFSAGGLYRPICCGPG